MSSSPVCTSDLGATADHAVPDSTRLGGVEFRGKARSVSFQALCPDITLGSLPSVRSPEEASRGAPRSGVMHAL